MVGPPGRLENLGKWAFPTRDEQYPAAHDMSPVASESGSRPAIRAAPHAFARENGQRARSPDFKIVLAITQVGESAETDRHYLKPDLGLHDYCYHESQLALLLNRMVAWAP